MSTKKLAKHSLEVLETRIAPAALLPGTNDKYVPASFNAPVEVFEGQVLNTNGDANSGTYFLFMEKGNALVFFTDLNNNNAVDFNEITGISVGDGARIVLFADVHGDIVTNLKETRTTVLGPNGQPTTVTKLSLSDSDNNAATDPQGMPGDGRELLNNRIEKIELRSLRTTDLPVSQDDDDDIDEDDVAARKAPSTYSIFGNIYAGRGFGAVDGGLIIDTTGLANFGFEGGEGAAASTVAMFGSIKTGTAASGEYFSFGVSRDDNVAGTIVPFVPPTNQAGGDIIGVRAVQPFMKFNFNGLYAGDGGAGARGGNIQDVLITGDDTGGYEIVAGNGGRGTVGGMGGSIINFSDLGSQTSKVVIRSGDGGTGTAGAGGNGGNFSYETFNVRGNVNLELGSGGDGFTSGGNGASLVKGDFTQPDRPQYTPANATGTTHLPSTENWKNGEYVARIGQGVAIDFDKDGLGDFVYTTRGTSQLVVALGNGTTYYLSGARNPEALTVADLNGDGVLDIATGSSDEGSHSGVAVFLGKFEHMGSGSITTGEDRNNNGVNDFMGFSDVRYSALPQGTGVITNSHLPFWESPHQISSMVAGDFDGNGKPELAVVVTYYSFKYFEEDGVTTSLEVPHQVLMFLTADEEDDDLTGQTYLTGHFYADFGTKGRSTGSEQIPAQPLTPFVILSSNKAAFESAGTPNIVIEATALDKNSSTHDVVLVGVKGARDVKTYDYATRANNVAPGVIGAFDLGQVDTDRLLPIGGDPHITPQNVTLSEFAVFDYNNDGKADIAAISRTPELFLVGVEGDGLGDGTQISNTDPGDLQNAGNYFGERGYASARRMELVSIRAADVDGDGNIDDVAIYSVDDDQRDFVDLLVFQKGRQEPNSPTNSTVTNGAILKSSTAVTWAPYDYAAPSAFAVYYPIAGDLKLPSFASADAGGQPQFVFTNGGVYAPLGVSAFELKAGDGGDSIVGNGGKGGSLGGGSSLKPVTRTFTDANGNEVTQTVTDLAGSLNVTMGGALTLIAGVGGDGFGNGGAGGDVTGVTVRQRISTDINNPEIALSSFIGTGDGGRGVAGKGGSGGDFLGSSIEGFTVTITTGDGGAGNIGGNGGTVRGNGTIVPDASTEGMTVITGSGGGGATRGGSGGNISGFVPKMTVSQFGFLSYDTGDGGNSVSGRGGDGGSITNSSPAKNAYLNYFVSLGTGNGGTGTAGGNGGNLVGFRVITASASSEPETFNVTAGHGGAGLMGRGGDGGDLIRVESPSRGLSSFNRLIAGNGGFSAAGTGGAGGDIISSSNGSVSRAVAVVAGAGGNGLTQGGRGGNVVDLDLQVGENASLAKGLVIAGAGGDAYAFIENINDGSRDLEIQRATAFGGTIGRGGAGGSINGVFQSGNQRAPIDLIAGDGGSTLNYGSLQDPRIYVGVGGSIKNVTLSGNAGNIDQDVEGTPDDENVPIKSYNNILAGETIAQYVESNLRTSTGTLTDRDGNVGIVVGIAGKNKAIQEQPVSQPFVYTSQPAQGSQNGSLISVHVNQVMSAVAGSVDRIAQIQLIKGLVASKYGVDKGSYKTPGIDPLPPDPVTGDLHKGSGTVGVKDYLAKDLNTPTANGAPVDGGALIDGAIVAKKILDSLGRPTTLS